MASTILRVKRRLEENPQDAIVLMCKKIKTDTNAELSPSLFVFRGTVDDQENYQVKNIVPQTDLKLKSSTNVEDIIKKLRKEHKNTSVESRFEIVSLSRGLKDNAVGDNHDVFNLVDLQNKKVQEEKDVQYAYDLYISPKQDFDVSLLDNIVSIENYETELILGSYRDNGRSPSTSEGDTDDSNDENNWRNDYPDSDHSSIDEEAIIKAVERCELVDELSSDEGEDKIYDNTNYNEDATRYGDAYAKYKTRVLSEMDDKNLVHCTVIKGIDEESIDGYKDDSDDGFYYGQEEDTEQFQEQYNDSDVYDPD